MGGRSLIDWLIVMILLAKITSPISRLLSTYRYIGFRLNHLHQAQLKVNQLVKPRYIRYRVAPAGSQPFDSDWSCESSLGLDIRPRSSYIGVRAVNRTGWHLVAAVRRKQKLLVIGELAFALIASSAKQTKATQSQLSLLLLVSRVEALSSALET